MTHEEYHEYENFIQQFKSITLNLWYTWDPEAQKLVDVLLSKTNHELSSYQRFNDLSEDQRQELFRNTHLRASVDHVYRDLQDYLSRVTWFDGILDKYPEYESLTVNPIAFLCAEYGFTDWLNIFSGGLGVLAGDLLKEASDLGIPIVGAGLLYQYGFFKQEINESGYQTETYTKIEPERLPLTQVRISTGAPLLIEVTIVDHPVYCRIWQMDVGRIPLYLLDTNIEENVREEDKFITGHLYGGDQDTRIRQEIVLGIGGERALSALGYHPTIFSMNEGHSAFAGLEITKHFMHERGMRFDRAREETKTKLIYTNHTVVPAGNDVFTYDLVNKYMGPYLIGLDISFDELFKLGISPIMEPGSFSMFELAFQMSMRTNAVSRQHGEVLNSLYPDRDIIAVTNGVHLPTWIHPRMQKLYDEKVSFDWSCSVEDYDLWPQALSIPDKDLWEARTFVKENMIKNLNADYGLNLSKEAMTITWARRFATYKRADLILEDIDRLLRIISDPNKPVQIIIAGKAHPKDTEGKAVMKRIITTIRDAKFQGKIVFVPNYEISLARTLVSGSDVWLNNPIPQDEASGTSGMKACSNGVLHCSTNGGWVAEVDWIDKGFLLKAENTANDFYELLEQKIIPLYFARNSDNIPTAWLSYMKNSIAEVCSKFSTKRTLKDYFNNLYTAAFHKQH